MTSITVGLNIPSSTSIELVEHMQKRVFIELRHLSTRPDTICSSLDGPNCFVNQTAGTGVIPEADASIGFSDLLSLFTREMWDTAPLVGRPTAASALVSSFQVTDQLAGRKIAPFYSSGLPKDVLASWDGRWLVESEISGFSVVSLASYLPGYLRFSQPLLLRRLWLEIPSEAKAVYVVMRREGQTVWMSRKFSGFSDHTIDVCEFGLDGHSPTVGVDEISVFSSHVGVKIVKIEMLNSSQVLVPGLLLAKTKNSDKFVAKQTLIDQTLIENEFVVSLHDAIKQRRTIVNSNFDLSVSNLDLFTIGVQARAQEMELLQQEIAKLPFSMPNELRKALADEQTESKRPRSEKDVYLAALLHV